MGRTLRIGAVTVGAVAIVVVAFGIWSRSDDDVNVDESAEKMVPVQFDDSGTADPFGGGPDEFDVPSTSDEDLEADDQRLPFDAPEPTEVPDPFDDGDDFDDDLEREPLDDEWFESGEPFDDEADEEWFEPGQASEEGESFDDQEFDEEGEPLDDEEFDDEEFDDEEFDDEEFDDEEFDDEEFDDEEFDDEEFDDEFDDEFDNGEPTGTGAAPEDFDGEIIEMPDGTLRYREPVFDRQRPESAPEPERAPRPQRAPSPRRPGEEDLTD